MLLDCVIGLKTQTFCNIIINIGYFSGSFFEDRVIQILKRL